MAWVKKTLATSRSSLYAVFVDLKMAIDSSPKDKDMFTAADVECV